MRSSIQIITPAKAQAMLAATTSKNRSLSKGIVSAYADDMSNGRWQENGESIILDDNGNVLDGQHRLSAIVISGVSQTMTVVSGVSPQCFKTIDTGRKRTNSDLLTIVGMKDARLLAAILAAVHTFKIRGEFKGTVNPSEPRLIKMSAGFDVVWHAERMMPLVLDSVSVAGKWSKKVPSKISPTLVGALHYIFAEIDKDDSDSFFENLIGVTFGSENDPLRRLYEACTHRSRRDSLAMDARRSGAIFIKAWNIRRKNEECKFLRFYENESYPVPI